MAEKDSRLSFSLSNRKRSTCSAGNDATIKLSEQRVESNSNKERQSAFKRVILRLSSRKKKPKVVEAPTNYNDPNGRYKEHCDEENESVSPLSSGVLFWRSFRKKKKRAAPEPSLESSVAYTITEEGTLTRDLRSSYNQSTSFLVSTESTYAKDNFESKVKSRKTSFWRSMFLRKSKIKSKDREANSIANKNEESVDTIALNNTNTASTITVELQEQPETSPKHCSKSKIVSNDSDIPFEKQDGETIASVTYIAEKDEKSTQEEDKMSVLEFVTLTPKGARTPPESKPEKDKKHSSRHHSSRSHSPRNHSSRHHKKRSHDRQKRSKSRKEKAEVKNEKGGGLDSSEKEETSKPAAPPRVKMMPPTIPPRTCLRNDPESFSRSRTIQITTPSLEKEKKNKFSKMLKFKRSHTEVKDHHGNEGDSSEAQTSSFKLSKAKNSTDDVKGNEVKPKIPVLHLTPTSFERKPVSPKKSSGFHLSIWKGQVLLLCHRVKH